MAGPAPRPARAVDQAARPGHHARPRPRAEHRRGRRPHRGRGRERRHRQARLGHGAGHRQPRAEARALPRARHPRRPRRHAHRAGDPAGPASTSWSAGSTSSRSTTSRSPTARSTLDARPQARADRRRSPTRFTVLSEVGSKDATHDHGPVPLGRADPGRARRGRVEGHLRGARVGDGRHRPARRRAARGPDRRDRPRDRPARLVFEAPQKDQQVHLLKRFGAGRQPRQHRARTTCSSLETMRLGLRSDTMDGTA